MKINKIVLIIIMLMISANAVFPQLLEFNMSEDRRESGMGLSPTKFSVPEQVKEAKASAVERSKEILALEGAINPDTYIVGPMDIFVLYIWAEYEEETPILVTSDGYLLIPYLGAINVGGKTLTEVNEMVSAKVKEMYRDAQFSFNLVEVRFIRVHVVGEVNNPGLYEMRATSRVTDAITIAGSTNTVSDLENIKIIRKDSNDTLSVDLLAYYQSGNLDENPMLYGGDQVLVKPVQFQKGIIEILGGFRKEGYYPLDKENSLRSVVSKVGGFNQNVDLTGIRVIREGVHNTVDLVNTEQDMILQNNDVVVLPHMPDSVYVEGFVNNPGAYPYRAGHTPTQYVGFAGGATDKGSESRVVIKRGNTEYEPDEILFVKRGDVIKVKQSYGSKVYDIIYMFSPLATIALTAYALDIFK